MPCTRRCRLSLFERDSAAEIHFWPDGRRRSFPPGSFFLVQKRVRQARTRNFKVHRSPLDAGIAEQRLAEGGLEYSMHGFTAYTDRTHWASEFDPGVNQRDPKLDDWAKTINHFSEATVSIKKGFGSKAWKPFAEAGGGIGANFHQQAKTNHNQIIAPTEFDEVSRPQASFRQE